MDIKCAKCKEPWDHYHMLHDEVWETWDGEDDSSSHILIKKFLEGPKTDIPQMLRDDLKSKGWVFGKTIVCILQCPCCKDNLIDVEAEERTEIYHELEDLLGDDIDGIISTLNDLGM